MLSHCPTSACHADVCIPGSPRRLPQRRNPFGLLYRQLRAKRNTQNRIAVTRQTLQIQPTAPRLCDFMQLFERKCTGNGPKGQGQSVKSPLSVVNSAAKDASPSIYCSWPSNIVAGQGNGRSALNPTLNVNVWRLGLTRRGDYRELCLWLRRTSPSTLDLYQASHPDKAWIRIA